MADGSPASFEAYFKTADAHRTRIVVNLRQECRRNPKGPGKTLKPGSACDTNNNVVFCLLIHEDG